jgi:tripartite-type tricarboxylate transporter receptor subunit TctC
MMVPVAAGGAVDAYTRVIADQMAKALNRVVIVENKPGGNGNVSYQFIAAAPADGDLIQVATQSMTEINPSAFENLKWSLNDFLPLIRGVTAPLVLVAHPSVPAKTFPELVAWIKRNPGKLSYASYTAGTPSHFLGFQLTKRFGLDLEHVPYSNSGAQVANLIAAHVLFGFAQTQTSLPQIAAGKLNAIAVTSGTRWRHLPNVPTFAELGYPEFTANIWFGLMVRAGTPPEVVTNLLNAAKAAHANPDVVSKLEGQGFDMSGESGPELLADIRTQAERWAGLIKVAGFKAY